MIILGSIVFCLLLAGGVVGVLAWLNLLPGWERDRGSPTWEIPRFGEMRQGCLWTMIVAAAVWFSGWAVVLVLALRFLRAPLR